MRHLNGPPVYEKRLTQTMHNGSKDGLRSVTSFDDNNTVWECKRTLALFRFAHWAYYVSSKTPSESVGEDELVGVSRIKTTTNFSGVKLSAGPATYTVEFVDTMTAGFKMYMIEIELEGGVAMSEFGFQDDEFVPSVNTFVREVLIPDRVWSQTIYGELLAMRIMGKLTFPIAQAGTLLPTTPIAPDSVVMYKYDGSRALLVVW
ncbi:hypothetical protein SARC_03974 [Sphaeroforma arctica JP610]|uniref:Uncharacterized protein n=1 Tax=Sphaeroforma arctica JP610 TaxID=667725 RepID=A0A0L0G6E4_9EUKA|nr:hypothetical protein SARC_03974 [Sphaeroforma arctica JP610]KNC83798.1 hypothetical protein SARC_03974 [Sphaeroforma arctica JP610]|eukprot:XP_014157700.1 hypothetical protein SARC_03974 [Sphaeroforma arctica JP610]